MAKLTDMEIDEVSIVDKGANKKRFAIVKSEVETMDKELTEIIKAVVGDYQADSASLLDAVKTIQKYMDSYPEDLLGAVKEVLGKMLVEPEKPEVTKEDVVTEEDIEKAGRKLSAKTKAELKAIAEKIASLLDEDEEPATPEKKMEKRIEALQAEIEKMKNTIPEEKPEGKPEIEPLAEILKRLAVIESSAGVKKELEASPKADEVIDEFPSFKI